MKKVNFLHATNLHILNHWNVIKHAFLKKLSINNFKVHIQSFETGDDSNIYKCTGGRRAHTYDKRQGIEANRYIMCVNF